MVSKSSNKIHQTWGLPFSQALLSGGGKGTKGCCRLHVRRRSEPQASGNLIVPPSIEVRGGGGISGRRGEGGAMMEGRGKVSLASSFYSSVAAAIEVGERPTEIDVDFSHSGRRRRRRSAATHSGASERDSISSPSLSPLSSSTSLGAIYT